MAFRLEAARPRHKRAKKAGRANVSAAEQLEVVKKKSIGEHRRYDSRYYACSTGEQAGKIMGAEHAANETLIKPIGRRSPRPLHIYTTRWPKQAVKSKANLRCISLSRIATLLFSLLLAIVWNARIFSHEFSHSCLTG